MAYDLDDALRHLALAPVHKGLLTIDDEVLRRIAVRRQLASGNSAGTMALAGFVAITLGIVSAGVPAESSAAAPTLSPFSPFTPLAPSTLLGSAR